MSAAARRWVQAAACWAVYWPLFYLATAEQVQGAERLLSFWVISMSSVIVLAVLLGGGGSIAAGMRKKREGPPRWLGLAMSLSFAAAFIWVGWYWCGGLYGVATGVADHLTHNDPKETPCES